MLASALAAFLVGVIVGAGGLYYVVRFTDRAHEREQQRMEKRAFGELAPRMRDLFKEMKADLEGESTSLVREFFVLPAPNAVLAWEEKHFRYDISRFEDLPQKIKMLEHQGFILDVSQSRNLPKYWLQESFVTLLRNWKS